MQIEQLHLTSNHEIYKIKGQSMESESIYEEDFVIINKKGIWKNKDIVVAYLTDGRFIVKHVEKEGLHLKFYPLHKDNPWMYIDDAEIKGPVIAIVCNREDHNHK